MVNDGLYEFLKELLHISCDHVEIKLKEGVLIPSNIEYKKWKMKSFGYGKGGVINKDGITNEIAIMQDWSNACITIQQYVLNTELAKKIQEIIVSQNPKNNFVLTNFLNRFLRGYLDKKIGFIEIDELCLSLVKELKGEPVPCKAIIQLLGIAIEPEIIDLSNGVIIRQTKKSDIEIPFNDLGRGLEIMNFPSAIMEIVSPVKQPMEMQSKIEMAVKILKLFKVGSVRYKSYRLYSHSLEPMYGGTHSTLDDSRPVETCFIGETEISSLKKFWHGMETEVIKLKRLTDTDVSFRDIAFARYGDSLMHHGIIERRIADCMMGLESMFLRDKDEQQELSYRLRLRVAKLMSHLGHDPFEVKKIVRDTYGIRSKFVHGGILDYESSKKLSEKYGHSNNLLLQLLNYLRISIVASLLIQVEKPKLIDTIDNSFLSAKSEAELGQILAQIKNVLDVQY